MMRLILERSAALEDLNGLNDYNDEPIDYSSLTNSELEEQYCLTGLFAGKYEENDEDDFEVVDG